MTHNSYQSNEEKEIQRSIRVPSGATLTRTERTRRGTWEEGGGATCAAFNAASDTHGQSRRPLSLASSRWHPRPWNENWLL